MISWNALERATSIIHPGTSHGRKEVNLQLYHEGMNIFIWFKQSLFNRPDLQSLETNWIRGKNDGHKTQSQYVSVMKIFIEFNSLSIRSEIVSTNFRSNRSS